jgi:hypothetical protein
MVSLGLFQTPGRTTPLFFSLDIKQLFDGTNYETPVRRTMNLDVTAVEKAEESIDAFIEKRTREKADANKVEDFWREQDRRHQARRRNALRGEWADLSMAEDHARRRAQLMAEGGYEPPSPEAA